MDNKECYIDKHDVEKIDFGLERICKLLEEMDNPQDKLKVIHVAGTNGKGSVSNYLAYILANAGYVVGKISSPAIFSKMEFAQILKKNIDYSGTCDSDDIVVLDGDEDIFQIYVEKYKEQIDKIKPSGYELQIALSLLYFYEYNIDVIIVETGMGGSLDATNVFKTTLCDVITAISMDHVGMIGDSLEEIAKCKCGIITPHGDVVTTSSNSGVLSVIQEDISHKDAKLIIAQVEDIKERGFCFNNNTFKYMKDEYNIQLNGLHQMENAIMAIEVIKVLNTKGFNIKQEVVKKGLSDTRQKARFDSLCDEPLIIVDGAHNEAGARCLVEAINSYIDTEKFRIIYAISMFKDKECNKVVAQFVRHADEIWTFATDNPRCMTSGELKEIGENELDIVNKTSTIMIEDKVDIDTICKCIDSNQGSLNIDKKTVYIFAGSLSFMKEVYERLI